MLRSWKVLTLAILVKIFLTQTFISPWNRSTSQPPGQMILSVTSATITFIPHVHAPMTRATDEQRIPLIKILYGRSWSGVYQDLHVGLVKEVPRLRVDARRYTAAGRYAILVGLLLMTAQMLGFGYLLLRFNPAVRYKVCMFLMVAITGMGTLLLEHNYTVGAFEIYFNDIKIWSKFESGRLPSVQDLLQIIAWEEPVETETIFLYDERVIIL